MPYLPLWVSDLNGDVDNCFENGWQAALDLIQDGKSVLLATYKTRETLLHYAARGLRKDYVELCLARGADGHACCNIPTRETALHCVIDSRAENSVCPGLEASIVRVLHNAGLDLDERTGCGETPLMMAVRFQRLEIVRELLNQGPRVGWNAPGLVPPVNTMESALYWAAHVARPDIVRVLLSTCSRSAHENETVEEMSLMEKCRTLHLDDVVEVLAEYGFR